MKIKAGLVISRLTVKLIGFTELAGINEELFLLFFLKETCW